MEYAIELSLSLARLSSVYFTTIVIFPRAEVVCSVAVSSREAAADSGAVGWLVAPVRTKGAPDAGAREAAERALRDHALAAAVAPPDDFRDGQGPGLGGGVPGHLP